ANAITAHRTARVRVHLDAELHLPLVPAFTIVYMSLYLLFLAAPFVLRTRRDVATLAVAEALAILLAGMSFLLVPAQLAFAPPTDAELGIWKPLFQFADRLNLDYNLVPSLHVALALVCLEMFAPHAGRPEKVLLLAWGILIAASTLLTHQHHVVDVLAGSVLAWGVLVFVRRTAH